MIFIVNWGTGSCWVDNDQMNMLSDSFLSCWLIFFGCSGGMGNILVAYLFLRVESSGDVVEDKRCVDM